MKVILALAALIAVVAAEPPAYGVPAPQPIRSGGYAPAEPEYQSQVFRHVYVHTAPDEPVDSQNRVIRVPGGDKHVNIIFVKTPSSSSQQQTEVILPEQDEHKNLVYVLLKKGEASSDIKVRRPAAPRQQKPEVYFIRYKDQEQQAGSGYGAPAPSAPIRQPSTQYGF
jgi:hypothetical protein